MSVIVSCLNNILSLFTWQSMMDVFSLISTFLVFLTLKEMQRERDCTYRPDILLFPETLVLKKGVGKPYASTYGIAKTDNGETERFDEMIATCINGGVGSAKNVKIRIEEESISEFVDFLKNEFCPSFHCEIFSFGYSFGYGSISKSMLEHEEVFMVAQAEKEYSLRIYTVVAWIIRQLLLEKDVLEDFNEKIIKDFPSLKVNVEYMDSQEVKYEKKFLIELKTYMVVGNKNDEHGIVEYGLNFTPKVVSVKKTRKKLIRK